MHFAVCAEMAPGSYKQLRQRCFSRWFSTLKQCYAMHAQLIHQAVRLKFRVNMTAETLAWLHCGGSDVVARKKMSNWLQWESNPRAIFFIRQEEDDLTTNLFLVHGSRGAPNDLSTSRNFGAEKVASKPPLKRATLRRHF